jgi:hypothetical protein
MQQQQQQQQQQAGSSGPGPSPALLATRSAPFSGYPRSGGLLLPGLADLLAALQGAHLYSDSKTTV